MGRVDHHAWNGRTRLERFLENVGVADDGCWIWLRPLGEDGYGQFCGGRTAAGNAKPIRAHAFLIGKPDGFVVHHKCGERACVRPDHMEIMSRSAHGKHHGERQKCEHGDLRRNARGTCMECDRLRGQRRRLDPAYRAKEAEWAQKRRATAV